MERLCERLIGMTKRNELAGRKRAPAACTLFEQRMFCVCVDLASFALYENKPRKALENMLALLLFCYHHRGIPHWLTGHANHDNPPYAMLGSTGMRF